VFRGLSQEVTNRKDHRGVLGAYATTPAKHAGRMRTVWYRWAPFWLGAVCRWARPSHYVCHNPVLPSGSYRRTPARCVPEELSLYGRCRPRLVGPRRGHRTFAQARPRSTSSAPMPYSVSELRNKSRAMVKPFCRIRCEHDRWKARRSILFESERHRVVQRYSSCCSADFLGRLPKVPHTRRLSRLPSTKQAAI
jgi:hypothetical protein